MSQITTSQRNFSEGERASPRIMSVRMMCPTSGTKIRISVRQPVARQPRPPLLVATGFLLLRRCGPLARDTPARGGSAHLSCRSHAVPHAAEAYTLADSVRLY